MVKIKVPVLCGIFALIALTSGPALAAGNFACRDLPTYAQLRAALMSVVDGNNAGLSNEMWATVVNRDGRVCAVAFTGHDAGDQWPGSRVISAQKANTANAFSLPADAGFGGGSFGDRVGMTPFDFRGAPIRRRGRFALVRSGHDLGP